ncbi:uncharacterized protein LOC132953759 [Metopolophium dirhodum]|uniref:uncharacterized protein LOC132953759 n=1 Tax=Metopolophium dirhodum TaxID=44670 RepID=UPI0029902F28|nr:uncharacterized protein LOC132953759 [Metopolophium dirhodum]
MNPGRTSKRWVVVISKESKDFSVVPINWLKLDFNLEDLYGSNISLVNYCQWPPFKVTSVELMKADDPDDTWKSFKVKILDGKIYVNFKVAWHKQVEIEFSVTESEQEAPKKKKIRLLSSSSDESQVEESSFSIMPVNSRKHIESEYYEPRQYTELQGNKVPDTYYKQQISVLPADQNPTTSAPGSIDDDEFSSNKNIDLLISTSQTPNCSETQFERRNYTELQVNNVPVPAIYDQQISILPAVQNPTPSTSGSIDNQFSSNRNIDQLMYPLPTTNFSTTLYKPYIATNSYNSLQSDRVFDNNISIDQSLSETLIKIQKELVANTFMLNRLLSKVEVLESNSKNNNIGYSSKTNQYIDSDFLSLFPMKTKEEFLSIEDKIVHDLDFVSKLESFIRSIGGCGTKNNITRVLQKIFIDEFAVIATLTGRGKNISVALGSSEIIKLVKRIIKANSNNVLTDSEYETVVANWLRHGNTRLGISNNK